MGTKSSTGRGGSSSRNRPAPPQTQARSQHFVVPGGGSTVQLRNVPGGPMIFYVDKQQPLTAPAIQDVVKVKNLANLLKNTLSLTPASERNPSSVCIQFHCDLAAETTVNIMFVVEEKFSSSGYTFSNTSKSDLFGVHPPQSMAADTDAVYTSSSAYPLDLSLHGPLLRYNAASAETRSVFPIVISLSYEVPLPESIVAADEVTKTKATLHSRTQTQYTFAEIVAQPSQSPTTPSSSSSPYNKSNAPIVKYAIRFLRQRLKLGDGALFDLDDIFGGGNDGNSSSNHDASGFDSNGDVVQGALIGADVCVEGDECVICLANERDTTVMPCRHMCLCSECAAVLRKQTNKCPICRTVIDQLISMKK